MGIVANKFKGLRAAPCLTEYEAEMSRKILMVAALAGMGLFLFSSTAFAQAAGECTGGACGTPSTSGGGCCCCGGSILVNNTDEGDTYQYADDYDSDGREDDVGFGDGTTRRVLHHHTDVGAVGHSHQHIDQLLVFSV